MEVKRNNQKVANPSCTVSHCEASKSEEGKLGQLRPRSCPPTALSVARTKSLQLRHLSFPRTDPLPGSRAIPACLMNPATAFPQQSNTNTVGGHPALRPFITTPFRLKTSNQRPLQHAKHHLRRRSSNTGGGKVASKKTPQTEEFQTHPVHVLAPSISAPTPLPLPLKVHLVLIDPPSVVFVILSILFPSPRPHFHRPSIPIGIAVPGVASGTCTFNPVGTRIVRISRKRKVVMRVRGANPVLAVRIRAIGFVSIDI